MHKKTNQYGFTYMWNLNKKTEQSIKQTIITTTKKNQRNRLINTEIKLVVAKGRDGGRG